MASQGDLFVTDHERAEKARDDRPRELKVLITVKAAPTPSVAYGETVCVAGISASIEQPGWLRLYPINFRFLDQELRFRKYDIVSVKALAARGDVRPESWRPLMDTLRVERSLKPWGERRPWVDPYIAESMCTLPRHANEPGAQSLSLIRARDVQDFEVSPHPGWTPEEQSKIDAYVNQLDLLETQDRTPLEAPRMRGWYRWRCCDSRCSGHRQQLLDWEFVALQRRLTGSGEAELSAALRKRFLEELCGPSREVAFYVGNQAKRHQTFSVLGVYYPTRR